MAASARAQTTIDLPGAAAALRMTWHEAYAAALSGRLGDLERRGRRYFLNRSTIERLVRERATVTTAD
jgi:hypothetical protein